jgi:hypothetical protein
MIVHLHINVDNLILVFFQYNSKRHSGREIRLAQ